MYVYVSRESTDDGGIHPKGGVGNTRTTSTDEESSRSGGGDDLSPGKHPQMRMYVCCKCTCVCSPTSVCAHMHSI